jgi:ATP-dependent Lhr-like helicase
VNPPFPFNMPWRMIQIIAMLQLYLEERWIEPPRILKYPLSMLFHQLMSLVTAAGELSPDALLERISSLSSFSVIDKETLRAMISYLVEKDHLQYTEEQGIIIGLEGEKIVNNFDFYAVFPEEEEWAVIDESTKIGMIEFAVPPGEYVTVAGMCWIVKAVDNEKRLIFVESTKRKIRFFWMGDRAIVHDRILKRMRRVLFEDVIYPYLQPAAIGALAFARNQARERSLDRLNIIRLGKDSFAIFPWLGHINYYILSKIISFYLSPRLNIKHVGGFAPYFLTVKYAGGNEEDLLAGMRAVMGSVPDPEVFLNYREIRQMKKKFEYKTPKFDRYVPDLLLKRQVIEDYIDIELQQREVDTWEAD